MNIEPPKDGFFIYTKSKCKYCVKAKALLPHARAFLCDEYLARARDEFLDFVDTLTDKKPRTFPMVFLNGTYIGGAAETERYLDELNDFVLDCDF